MQRPARINIKALVILATILILLVTGLAVGYKVRKRMIADRALAAGKAALANQDWETASRQLRLYLSKYPDDEEILESYAKARLAIRPYTAENVAGAISAYRRLLQRFRPGDEKICAELARLYLAVQNYDDCAYICRQRLKADPGDPVAMFYLANALARQRKAQEAIPVLESLISAHPEHVRAYFLRAEVALAADSQSGPDVASEWFNKAIEANPKSAEALVNRARFMRERRKDKDQARADLEAAWAMDSTDPGVILTLAEEWLHLGFPDHARSALSQVESISDTALEKVDLVPGPFQLRRFLAKAQLALRLKSPTECTQVANEALEGLKDGVRTEFLPVATELYLQADRNDLARKAVEDYRAALAKSSAATDPARGQLDIMDAAVLLREQKPYAAMSALSKFLLSSPEHASAWRMLWEAYRDTDQPQAARYALEKYLERQPADGEASLALAEALLRDDPARAWRFARTAEQLSPSNANATVLRIDAALRAGRFTAPQLEEFSPSVQKLRETLPRDARVAMLEAIIEGRRGNSEAAVANLEKIDLKLDHAFAVLKELAWFHSRNGDRPRAIKLMQRMVEHFATRAEPRINLSRLLEDARNPDEAGEVLIVAVRELAGEERVAASYALASFSLRKGSREQGMKILRELAGQRPEDAKARILLLGALEIVRHAAEAQSLVDQLKNIEDPGGLRCKVEQARVWMYQKDWKAREKDILELLAACRRAVPTWTAPVLVLGRFHEIQGRIGEAVSLFREVLDSDPGNADVATALFAILLTQKRFAEAEEAIDRVTNVSERLAGMRIDVAIGQGKFENAIAALEDRIGANPQDATAMVVLAQLLQSQMGNTDRALELLESAERIAPDILKIYTARAEILWEAGRHDEAMALLDSVVERIHDFQSILIRAEFKEKAGDLGGSEVDYQGLVGLDGQNPDGYLAYGNFLKRNGRGSIAISQWKKGLERSPGHLPTQKAMALALAAETDENLWRQGKAQLEALVASNPEDAELLEALANLLLQENEKDPAVRKRAQGLLDKVVQLNPRNIKAQVQLIGIIRNDEGPQAGIDQVTKALGANPEAASLKLVLAQLEAQRGNGTVARELARSVVSEQPQNLAAHQLLAALALQSGDLASARTWNQAALTIDPQNEVAHLMHAKILRAQGDSAGAIEWLDSYSKKEAGRTSTAALVTLSELYRGSGDLKSADVRLRAAEEAAPDSRAVLSERLRLLTAAGQYEAIIPRLSEWRAKHPDDMQAVVDASLLIASSGTRERLEQAGMLLQEVLRREPRYKDARNGLALAEYQLGNMDRATAAYRQVLEQDPYDQQALNDLAWILGVELDQPTEAIRLADRAIGRYPDDATILDTRGVVLLRLGRLPEARVDLERCVVLEAAPSATRTAALVHLGEVLVLQGDLAAARVRLVEARELDGKHATLDARMRTKLEELLKPLS